MSQALAVNSKLFPYHIISKIGAGGMGKVYLAQDTNLDRGRFLNVVAANSQYRNAVASSLQMQLK